jgi:hypothetical protein
MGREAILSFNWDFWETWEFWEGFSNISTPVTEERCVSPRSTEECFNKFGETREKNSHTPNRSTNPVVALTQTLVVIPLWEKERQTLFRTPSLCDRKGLRK